MRSPRSPLTFVGVAAAAAWLAGCIFDDTGAPLDASLADAATPPDGAPADAGTDAPVAPVSGPVLAGLPPAELGSGSAAQAWARRASAPQVFFTAYAPIYQADQSLLDGESCPVIIDSGALRSYTGNCTNSKGDVWSGNAMVVGTTVNGIPGSVTYANFGHTFAAKCDGEDLTGEQLYTGTVVRGSALPALPIVVDLDVRDERVTFACTNEVVHTGIDYHLTVDTGGDSDNDGTPDTRTWNGTGRVGDTAGATTGRVIASTAAEFTGQACSKEALAGSTTIAAGAHSLVIGYDGATDCDDDSTATWSLDGVPQGELTGIFCALAAPGRHARGPGGGALVLAGAALLLAARARRRGRGDGGR